MSEVVFMTEGTNLEEKLFLLSYQVSLPVTQNSEITLGCPPDPVDLFDDCPCQFGETFSGSLILSQQEKTLLGNYYCKGTCHSRWNDITSITVFMTLTAAGYVASRVLCPCLSPSWIYNKVSDMSYLSVLRGPRSFWSNIKLRTTTIKICFPPSLVIAASKGMTRSLALKTSLICFPLLFVI